MSRGSRESEWLVVRRCLAILSRVQRGPADWKELVRAVLVQEGTEAYGGTEGQALKRRLENDLRRIQHGLQGEIYFDQQ